ncbi:MAG: LCP family protein [Pseudanabaenaceae cyanobacterium bins.68]|nr:LCP family protein [Pseudanabaenaceae cyanobacterium bins.68]
MVTESWSQQWAQARKIGQKIDQKIDQTEQWLGSECTPRPNLQSTGTDASVELSASTKSPKTWPPKAKSDPGNQNLLKAIAKNFKLKSKLSRKSMIVMGLVMAVSAALGAGMGVLLSSKPLQTRGLSREESTAFVNSDFSSISLSSLGIPVLSRPVNILLLGTVVLTTDLPGGADLPRGKHFNQVEGNLEGQSDSMTLLRFDPSLDRLVALSIPRDSQVEIDGIGLQKINAANFVGGAALSAKTTSALLGNVAIDRYVRVNVGGFGQLIDALGGVEIYVPRAMKYQDDSQRLYINLAEGRQVLDGAKAIQYMRFRHDDLGDIGRVQRQQTLLRSLIEQKLNLATVVKIPQILALLKNNIDTNLSTEEMLAVAAFAAKVGRANTKMLMLPGRFSSTSEFELSYWLVDPPKIAKLMADYFGLPNSSAINHQLPVRIAIQDSLRQTKGVLRASKMLSSLGYNDTRLAEQAWSEPLTKTQIVAQSGDIRVAEQLRDRLGIGEVVVEATGDLDSDLTLRLGQDWLEHQQQFVP